MQQTVVTCVPEARQGRLQRFRGPVNQKCGKGREVPTDHEAPGQEIAATAARVRSRRRATCKQPRGDWLDSGAWPRRQSRVTVHERNGLEVLGTNTPQTLAVPAGSRRQCLAVQARVDSKEKNSHRWDPRTQERKEHRQLQTESNQPSVKETGNKHQSDQDPPQTQCTQQDRGDARCDGALRSHSSKQDIEIPVSTQRQPGSRRSWRFLSCSTLMRRLIPLLRAEKSAWTPQDQSNENRVDDTVTMQTSSSSSSSAVNSEDA